MSPGTARSATSGIPASIKTNANAPAATRAYVALKNSHRVRDAEGRTATGPLCFGNGWYSMYEKIRSRSSLRSAALRRVFFACFATSVLKDFIVM